MKQHSFPALEQALAGYLHQDFLCDYTNADEAVAAFVSSEPLDLVASAREELCQFIPFVERANNPAEVLLGIGCYYDPSADGMTVVEWLRKVQKLLGSK